MNLEDYITETIAASDLALQAFEHKKQSIAYFLIESACKLDSSLSEQALKQQWLNTWLIANKQRSLS